MHTHNSHEIVVCGLGRMGGQIARMLRAKNFRVYGWNRQEEQELIEDFKNTGGFASADLAEVVQKISKPRIFWIMLPTDAVEAFVMGKDLLGGHLKKGDIIIDGGNSHFQESVRRSEELAKKGIYYFDCGVAGGLFGEQHGFALMVGGPEEQWPVIEPIIKALSTSETSSYLGPTGTGHFTKMVHNGIEYGMMESIAEGFAVLEASPFKPDLVQVAQLYQKGSVIRSWLLDLTKDILQKENFEEVKGIIDTTGEGKWTIHTAKQLGIDVRVIEDAYAVRTESREVKHQDKFSNKIVALLRKYFGGHPIHKK
jgi:6-phosphogluconate dehydrogenase